MRRRLALLVVATTSVVLLAFLLPLAVLVNRAARTAAVSEATARSQVIVSAVASGATSGEIDEVVAQLASAGFVVRVRPVAPALAPRSTVVRPARGGLVVRQPVVGNGTTQVVDTFVPRAQLRAGVGRAWAVLVLLGLVLVGLSLVVADRLARAMTAPITDLARVAHRLAHGDLEARVRPSGPDEVRGVGEALNLLAARIGALLASEREAVADLSHRLRTPITALRLGVESLPTGADRDGLTAAVDELTRQVDRLIVEARRPVREGLTARCDAAEVTAERVAFWQALAEDQQRDVELTRPEGPVWVRASRDDLEATLDALLGNVIAHTPEGAGFSVAVRRLAIGGGEVVVSDRGPGFSDAGAVRRGHSGAGSTGLGLDIARRTATASGGELELGRSPAGGGEVRLRLGAPAGPTGPAQPRR